MRQAAQFERVQLICEHLKSERNGGEHTPNEAVSVAAAYLIACDRTGRVHHPEDNPRECFDPGPLTDAQQAAHDAVWEIIGDANTLTNGPRYEAAWDVWGIIGHTDVTPGMQADTI